MAIMFPLLSCYLPRSCLFMQLPGNGCNCFVFGFAVLSFFFVKLNVLLRSCVCVFLLPSFVAYHRFYEGSIQSFRTRHQTKSLP